MTRNYYDQASRYAAKLDPAGFIRWALRTGQVLFRRWLDTRRLPFPGEPDRTCDTVAELEDPLEPGVLWAAPLEFMLEPEGDFCFRLLVYLGQVALDERPSSVPGDRYRVGAIVVNLTGMGRTSLDMRLGTTGMATSLLVAEHNLVQEDAGAALAGIVAGTITRALLPFVPLMQGGDDPAIMQRWIQVASAEPDARRRGDYAGLALVFAEAADCRPLWKQSLQGWNMTQSQQVLEWMAEGEAKGRAEGRAASLLRVLRRRFGTVPPEVDTGVRACADLARLDAWLDEAATAADLNSFRTAAGL